MKLGPRILKILNKYYEPDTMIEKKFGRYAMTFKTDHEGYPVLLFLGTRNGLGIIKGERFARRLKKTAEGIVVKDHWEHKGKAS